jgi:putative tricarboxylic transport membrane protein
MYLGNIMLIIPDLPLIGLWVKILKVPYWILFSLILLFCLIGAYSMEAKISDLVTVVIFGVLGYFMKKFKYEEPPLIFAFVLAPMFENVFRQRCSYPEEVY